MAKTTNTSATGALVMNVLLPLSTSSSPRRATVVASANASEPLSGSVIPWTPMIDPSHMPGSQRAFCSAVPKRAIGVAADQRCALSEKIRPLSRQP